MCVLSACKTHSAAVVRLPSINSMTQVRCILQDALSAQWMNAPLLPRGSSVGVLIRNICVLHPALMGSLPVLHLGILRLFEEQ